MQSFSTERAPAAIGPYSQAIRSGQFLFSSGQIGVKPGTREFKGPTIEAQAEQALNNLAAVLESAGLSLSHVVKTTVFLKNFGDFAAMNAIYAQAFGAHQPARSTVEVARLPMDGLIEIEAIASFA